MIAARKYAVSGWDSRASREWVIEVMAYDAADAKVQGEMAARRSHGDSCAWKVEPVVDEPTPCSSLAAANEAKEKAEGERDEDRRMLCQLREICRMLIEAAGLINDGPEDSDEVTEEKVKTILTLALAALHSPAPCPHEARVKALEEEVARLKQQHIEYAAANNTLWTENAALKSCVGHLRDLIPDVDDNGVIAKFTELDKLRAVAEAAREYRAVFTHTGEVPRGLDAWRWGDTRDKLDAALRALSSVEGGRE